MVYPDMEDEMNTRAEICVNACIGIPDSLLTTPGYSIKHELDDLDEEINARLKAEHRLAALLAAMKEAMEIMDTAISKAQRRN